MPNIFTRAFGWARSLVSPKAALEELVASLPSEEPRGALTAYERPTGQLRTLDVPDDVARSISAASRGSKGPLAPWPATDRNPTVIGNQLTFQAVATAYRLALTGYRQRYADVLGELLDHDPHAFGVLSQRILAVAGARYEFKAPVPPDHPRYHEALEVADHVAAQFAQIPKIQGHYATLLWSLYYGVSASEIHWRRVGSEWWVDRLTWIHTRRLAYPDSALWELHVWDQGAVGPGSWGAYPTASSTYGLRVSDFPGKFVVHTPQLRADYPTREGLGRIVGNWMLLKRFAARASSQYLDRFARPIGLGTWGTTDTMEPRAAVDEDVVALKAALESLGLGTLTSYAKPDCIKVDILNPDATSTAKLTFTEFLSYADAQVSKGVLGQTYTTEPGKFGAKGTAEVGKEGAMQLARFDAADFADTLRRDIVAHIVRLNRPNAVDLVPCCEILVDDEPSPEAVMAIAVQAASIGMPLDAEDLAKRTGLVLVDPGKDARRLALVKPAELSAIDETIEPPTPPPMPGAVDDDGEPANDDEPADEEDNDEDAEPDDEAA